MSGSTALPPDGGPAERGSIAAVWFDLYGTLVALDPLIAECEAVAPGSGSALADRWRRRQLEASWLRSLMGAWQPFDVVTRDALRSAATELAIDQPLGMLDGAFERLPARPDAVAVLGGLRRSGLLVGVLSNGSGGMIARTLTAAGLDGVIDVWRSVDEVRRYKPDPAVYRLAVERSGVAPDRVAFVTANGWDAAGAAACGLDVLWLRSSGSEQLPAVGAPMPRVATWEGIVAAIGA